MACLSASFSSPLSSSSSSSSAKNTVIARRVPVYVTRRKKNRLRSKILKTLTKPHTSPPLLHQEFVEAPGNLSETLEIAQEVEMSEIGLGSDGDLGECSEEFDGKIGAGFGEAETSSPDVHGLRTDAVFITRSVAELALYFVGLFVVQTVCTVVVMGSSGAFKKSENGEGEAELAASGTRVASEGKKEGFLFGKKTELGAAVYVDESRMKEKIGEIRAMARKARESETKKSISNGDVSSSDVIGVDGNEVVHESGVFRIKTNIENEVDQRLSKLEKKLRSLEEKSSKLVNYSVKNKYNNGLERSDDNAKDEAVVSKKKSKFKYIHAKPRNNPKGFGNTKDRIKVSRLSIGSNESNALGSSNRKQQVEVNVTAKEEESNWLTDDSLTKSLTRSLENGEANRHFSVGELSSFQDPGRKADEEGQSLKRGIGMTSEKTTKSRSSGIQETFPEIEEPRELIELEMINSPQFVKEYESQPMVNKVIDERMNIQNDSWWMNLPYALAIMLRKGSESSDHEGPRGLYCLKIDEGSSSYTVAFEDQRDATNFCYILETFFEELGDFRADVVPLSIRELKDAIKSSAMKIIVVRKGQLKLYAGQPLTDVETTLRSFIK